MDQMLHKRLRPVVRRIQIRRVTIALGVIWLIAALIAGWFYYRNLSSGFDISQVLWLIVGGTIVASALAVFHAIYNARGIDQIVGDLEREFPDLDASLMTAAAIESKGGRPGFLELDVLRKAVTHSYENQWPSIVPGWHLLASPLACLLGLIALATTMVCLMFFSKPPAIDQTIQFADAVVDVGDFQFSVEPGNTEVERGTSLLVLARFADGFPPDATLVFADEDGVESRLPMSKSLDDPVFGARISSVNGPLTYRVEFAQQASNPFDVSVFDFPKLVQADAKLDFPDYTKKEDKVIQDFRRINAVEGTKAEFSFFVNKPIEGAILVPQGDEAEVADIELVADPDDPKKMNATIQMEQSQKFELVMVDKDNRENRSPPKFVLNVLENRPPELKLLAPGKDVDASPIEEVQLSASGWDDFGLSKFGVSYNIVGQEPKVIELEQKSTGKKRKQVDHLLELEKLEAEPDNLVSYHFFAEDIGPDGQPRTVASDMFFAEVRHFEEIFRQGQAQAGQNGQQQQQQGQGQGQGQNAQKAQELGKLQKEIINGTWRVIRRETNDSLTDKFGDDVKLLVESQNQAIAQLDELAGEIEDERSLTYVEAARTFMNEAVLHLTSADNNADVESLKPALSSEQAAYQGLLKLRAREHEVVRQQQQQQQGQQQGQQQNNRSQEQLNELELKEDTNRYENEKTAQEQTEQQAQQQEDRQVLSRLRELARRQSDLNERVKELQSALEEAKTEEEREEIERRLKSLREQQEQMLRDTEELAERMQNEENRERMSEESEQLDKTRENIQRAAEALKNNEVSRAAAEGTRAERELEELRDEFQNRTAGQFTEQMRQMRNEAQTLEQKEQEIANALDDSPKPEEQKISTSLREESDDEKETDLQQQLRDQRDAIEKLRSEMRETIEEAESFEPLLAEELYETYRDSETTRPAEALESARRSLSRGWLDDAKKEEAKARAGISQLREGIEKAAQSVLGDETEALKAARETLDELKRELDQELRDKAPDRENERSESEDGKRQNGEPRDGEARDGEARDGEPNERNQKGRAGDREGESDEERDEREQRERDGNSKQGERGEGKAREENQKGERGQNGKGERGQEQEDAKGERGEGQRGERTERGEGQRGERGEGEGERGESEQAQPSDSEQPQEGEGGQQPGEGRGQGQNDQEREAQEGRGQGQNDQEREGQQGRGQGQGGDRQNQQDADLQNDAERMRQQMRELGNEQVRQNGGRLGGAPNAAWDDGDQRMRPISGEDFRDWSDRLRDVEEMISDPDLRAEASRIREQAREIRKEMKRHSEEPNWDLVKLKVAKPLAELQDRVAEELMRRGSKDVLVPLDRDPVPAEYQEAVRRYYERLGSGK